MRYVYAREEREGQGCCAARAAFAPESDRAGRNVRRVKLSRVHQDGKRQQVCEPGATLGLSEVMPGVGMDCCKICECMVALHSFPPVTVLECLVINRWSWSPFRFFMFIAIYLLLSCFDVRFQTCLCKHCILKDQFVIQAFGFTVRTIEAHLHDRKCA